MANTEISRNDILDYQAYLDIRPQRKAEIIALKKLRRIEIGPVACCYFESFDTMLYQVQEMLYIEKGGDEQVADELAAYNPMIPNGTELSCTVMFEIDEPIRRANFLARLGGVEETMFLRFGEHEVAGKPEEDVDRTNADGKASSVQFIHFAFTKAQIRDFIAGTQVVIGFSHPQYAHMVVLQDETVAALAKDFHSL
ncbi:MAG: DUF3501 family protein [Pseudomonadales bacterium]